MSIISKGLQPARIPISALYYLVASTIVVSFLSFAPAQADPAYFAAVEQILDENPIDEVYSRQRYLAKDYENEEYGYSRYVGILDGVEIILMTDAMDRVQQIEFIFPGEYYLHAAPLMEYRFGEFTSKEYESPVTNYMISMAPHFDGPLAPIDVVRTQYSFENTTAILQTYGDIFLQTGAIYRHASTYISVRRND